VSIIHAFLEWVTAWLWPATGRRRAGRPVVSAVPPRACVQRAAAPRAAAPRAALPARRSLYGLEGPLEGERVALVRPYLVHWEQRQQRERRRALELALDGVDAGPEWIHGVRVGAGVV
jgi:hypothetical protein